MAKKRRLTDLYVKEKIVTFDDGNGAISILLKKMNPVDHESAFRMANAARARLVSQRNDFDSEAFQAVYSEAIEMDRNDLISSLINEKLDSERLVIEARISSEDEWSKDDYFQGLNDAWNSELSERFSSDPDDEEASRVHDELRRFTDLVQKELDHFSMEARSVFDSRTDDEIARSYTELLMRLEGDLRWVMEYRKASIFYMVFDPDTKRRYFDDRAEVDMLSQEVLTILVDEIESLNVDVMEGKDSLETPAS